jgi:hypothetical protein
VYVAVNPCLLEDSSRRPVPRPTAAAHRDRRRRPVVFLENKAFTPSRGEVPDRCRACPIPFAPSLEPAVVPGVVALVEAALRATR